MLGNVLRWMYKYANLSNLLRPQDREEMRDTYSNLTNVFDKSAQRTKHTLDI